MILVLLTKIAAFFKDAQRANVLAKKIALLSDKPLPTQEQIDWRVENRSDIISMKRKGTKQKKKMLKYKREIFTG